MSWIWVRGHESSIQVFPPGFWNLNLRSLVLNPASWVPSPDSWVPVHSIIIKKCDKNYYKVWQKVIAMCGRYYKVWEALQSATKGYYKVWQLLQSVTRSYYIMRQVLQSVTFITKWSVTHLLKKVKLLVFRTFGKFNENDLFITELTDKNVVT